LPWSVRSAYRFKAPAHINLQEARALRREIKHLARADSVAKRVLVFIDSLVVLGAFAKGRSSNFKLNRILRSTLPYLTGTSESCFDLGFDEGQSSRPSV
jgi:hypothetical protein